MLSIGVVPRDDSIPVERRLSVHTELVLYSIHGQTSLWSHFSAALPTEAAAPLRPCASPERTLYESVNTLSVIGPYHWTKRTVFRLDHLIKLRVGRVLALIV
jgi:hypothetical protein